MVMTSSSSPSAHVGDFLSAQLLRWIELQKSCWLDGHLCFVGSTMPRTCFSPAVRPVQWRAEEEENHSGRMERSHARCQDCEVHLCLIRELLSCQEPRGKEILAINPIASDMPHSCAPVAEENKTQTGACLIHAQSSLSILHALKGHDPEKVFSLHSSYWSQRAEHPSRSSILWGTKAQGEIDWAVRIVFFRRSVLVFIGVCSYNFILHICLLSNFVFTIFCTVLT